MQDLAHLDSRNILKFQAAHARAEISQARHRMKAAAGQVLDLRAWVRYKPYPVLGVAGLVGFMAFKSPGRQFAYLTPFLGQVLGPNASLVSAGARLLKKMFLA